MAKDTCILCWKKEATEVFVQGVVRVCKGCQYEVNRVLNFMAYFGYGVGPIDTELPLEPPTPNSKKAKPAAKAGKPRKEWAEGEGSLPGQPELPGTPPKPQ